MLLDSLHIPHVKRAGHSLGCKINRNSDWFQEGVNTYPFWGSQGRDVTKIVSDNKPKGTILVNPVKMNLRYVAKAFVRFDPLYHIPQATRVTREVLARIHG